MSKRQLPKTTYKLPAEYCRRANKIKYPKLKDAQTALNHTRKERGKEGAQRHYKCEHCDGYHLTHLSDWKEDIKGPDIKNKSKFKKLISNEVEPETNLGHTA